MIFVLFHPELEHNCIILGEFFVSFCSFKNMWKKSFINKTFSVSFGCVCACERICSTWKFHLMFHCSVFHHFFKLRLSFYLYLRMLCTCLHQLLFVLVKSVNFMQKYCIFITSIINSIVNNNIQQIWFYSTIFGFFATIHWNVHLIITRKMSINTLDP